MSLILTESISLFTNIQDVNGFRIPDRAYVDGRDFICFEQLGSSLYFSNYWIGSKEDVYVFAEQLATYFKEQYGDIEHDPDDYDFRGMVLIWDLNSEMSMVGNVNLLEDLAFWCYDNGVPPELESILNGLDLTLILNDANDNCATDVLFDDSISNVIKDAILPCLSEAEMEDYVFRMENTSS